MSPTAEPGDEVVATPLAAPGQASAATQAGTQPMPWPHLAWAASGLALFLTGAVGIYVDIPDLSTTCPDGMADCGDALAAWADIAWRAGVLNGGAEAVGLLIAIPWLAGGLISRRHPRTGWYVIAGTWSVLGAWLAFLLLQGDNLVKASRSASNAWALGMFAGALMALAVAGVMVWEFRIRRPGRA